MMHLVLATDFSDNAWRAMSFAANIFSQTPCNYHLLSASKLPIQLLDESVPVDTDFMLKENEKCLDDLLIEFMKLKHHESSTFKRESFIGPTVQCIKSAISSHKGGDPSLVVIGSHGSSGIADKVLGTTSTDILVHCDSPVLCIPETCSLDMPAKLMLATDYHIINKTKSLGFLTSLIKLFHAELVVVNVKEKEEIFLEDSPEKIIAEHFFKDVKHSYHTLEGKIVTDELVYFSNKEKIDLIVLLRKDDKFLSHLFKDSNIKTMNFYGNRPILVM